MLRNSNIPYKAEFGQGSMVLGWVNIGNHVVVGANVVVLEDMPDYAVCAGVPARVLYQLSGDNAK